MIRKAPFIGLVLALAALLAAVLAFASRYVDPQPPDAQSRAITDMTARHVRVPVTPRRILSLATTATDTLIALGGGDRLAAIDEYSRVVPGSGAALIVGRGGTLSREAVTALRIDLAFIWWYQDDAAALLEDLRVPVVRLKSGRAADVPAAVRLIGHAADLHGPAESLAGELESFVARASADAAASGGAGRRVFLELHGPYRTMGADSYIHDLLELAGAVNVAAGIPGSAMFSPESLALADPDLIIVTGDAGQIAAFSRRPGTADLSAVRGHRVFALDPYQLVAGPGLPRSVDRIRALLAGQPSPLSPEE